MQVRASALQSTVGLADSATGSRLYFTEAGCSARPARVRGCVFVERLPQDDKTPIKIWLRKQQATERCT